MISEEQIFLDALQLLPRDSGKNWPSNRSWTDSERLELCELHLRQAVVQRSEARQWAKEFKRIAEAIWTDDYDTKDINLLFDGTPTMPDWLKDGSVVEPQPDP